jgi:AcrR family transcriptional regulator
MYQGNLYNYVQSKRELFFAIIKNGHEKFRRAMDEIVQNHKGSYIDLMMKLAENYVNFAQTQPNVFKMMFSTPAPLSKKTGPIEKSFKPQSLDVLVDVLKLAIKNDEIWEVDADLLSHFLWGIIHGSVLVSQSYVDEYPEDPDANKKFHNFSLMQFKHIIDRLYTKIS